MKWVRRDAWYSESPERYRISKQLVGRRTIFTAWRPVTETVNDKPRTRWEPLLYSSKPEECAEACRRDWEETRWTKPKTGRT